VLALLGIFALAAVFAPWNFAHRRSIERRLAAQGFEPCDEEAPSLERAWRALAGSDASQELRLVHCRRRASGRGMLHHFTVRERPARERERRTDETTSPGASYPAYLFDVRDADSLSRGAVTLPDILGVGVASSAMAQGDGPQRGTPVLPTNRLVTNESVVVTHSHALHFR
jgi:hypothetical protein